MHTTDQWTKIEAEILTVRVAMKRFLAPQVVFALLAALVTLPACGLSYAVKSPPGELEQAFQEDIDSLTALYSRLTVPQHLVSPSPVFSPSGSPACVVSPGAATDRAMARVKAKRDMLKRNLSKIRAKWRATGEYHAPSELFASRNSTMGSWSSLISKASLHWTRSTTF